MLPGKFSRMSRFVVCCTTFLIFLNLFSLHAYAQSYKPVAPHYPNDPPDLTCLDVTTSSVTNVHTIAVTNPVGGAVQFNTYLYVINTCTTDNPVSSITIVGNVVSTCPEKSVSTSTPFTYMVPYPLYNMAGAGKQFTITDNCIVLENGVPTTSILPTGIQLNIDASGSSASGRDVFAPGAVYNVW